MRKIKVGSIYKHFKGNLYQVLAIAQNTETEEQVVVYVDIKNDKTWVRPYDMFNSLVDKEKYPDLIQKYRFEEQNIEIKKEIDV